MGTPLTAGAQRHPRRRSMVSRRGALAIAVVACGTLGLALLAGCAGGPGDRPSPTPQPGGSVSVPPPPPPPSASPRPSSPAGEMTITGQVIEGVEAGCLLLRTGTEDYLLVLPGSVDRSAVVAGARLEARGRLAPDLVSYCQQGIPFQVSQVRPA